MSAELFFSSEWLKDSLAFQQHLDDLQFAIIDRMSEKNATTFVVTTTRDMETRKRNYWVVDTDFEDSTFFYKAMMNDGPGSIDIFEDSDGVLFARYRLGDRTNIWKFHFLHHIEDLIDDTLSHLGSFYYEDFRNTMEYTLQDADLLSYTEELSVDWIEDGLEAEFFFSLPYMQDPIIHGTLYYEDTTNKWLIEEGSISYDDAFEYYVEECLY